MKLIFDYAIIWSISEDGTYNSGAESYNRVKIIKLIKGWYRLKETPFGYHLFCLEEKKNMTNWEELKWRGLVKDVAGDDIADKINNEKVTFYWGTDPTADSLHLGHYSSLITAKRLMKMGHNPILFMWWSNW